MVRRAQPAFYPAGSHSEGRFVNKVAKSNLAPGYARAASGGSWPSFTSGIRKLFEEKKYREIGSAISTHLSG